MAYRSFETKESIAIEKEIGEEMKEHFGAEDIWFCPKFYPVDAALLDSEGGVTHLLEIKYRTIASTDYDTFTMDLSKMQDIEKFEDYAKTYLVVRWTDITGYIPVSRIYFDKISVLKRHNKRYEGDHKLVVEIPIDQFTTREKE